MIELAPGRTRRSSASLKDVEAASLVLSQVRRLAGNLRDFADSASASAKKKPANSRATCMVLARAGRASICCYRRLSVL